MNIHIELPSASEINVYNSPDEKIACDHFLNKTLIQAEELFKDDSSYYQEDLMWMGPKAFPFYLQAAISYLQSPAAAGDDHLIDCLYEIVLFRINQEEFNLAVDCVNLMIDYVIKNYEKFDIDQKIYANLREKYEQLQQRLSDMA